MRAELNGEKLQVALFNDKHRFSVGPRVRAPDQPADAVTPGYTGRYRSARKRLIGSSYVSLTSAPMNTLDGYELGYAPRAYKCQAIADPLYSVFNGLS